MKTRLACMWMLLVFTAGVRAQDTLPRFTVIYKGNNRNVISWTNPFRHTTQISIQRSADSTRNFKTILTVPDPNVPQNGYVDVRNTTPLMFYRLFIVLDSGRYQFSRSKRPAPDTARVIAIVKNESARVSPDSVSVREAKVPKEKLPPPPPPRVVRPEKFFIVLKRDTVLGSISEKYLKHFRDSIAYATKDTLVLASADTIVLKPFVPKEIYRPSKFVFTEKYGNVMIALPDASSKRYTVNFFDDKRNELFEIKEVKSTALIVDKSNFVHAGWFWFELYEDGKLKEKNRFFLPRDF